MLILGSKITVEQLKDLADNYYCGMVKAVADIRLNKLALDAELHSDLEALLLENGSCRESLWGFNIYPEQEGDDFIEFDSLINIRPRQNNRSWDVENKEIRRKIVQIVNDFIIK